MGTSTGSPASFRVRRFRGCATRSTFAWRKETMYLNTGRVPRLSVSRIEHEYLLRLFHKLSPSLIASTGPLQGRFSVPQAISSANLEESDPSQPSESDVVLFYSLSPVSTVPHSHGSSTMSDVDTYTEAAIYSSPAQEEPGWADTVISAASAV